MRVEVKFLATFREVTGKREVSVEVDGCNIGHVIDALTSRFGERFKQELLDSDGKLREHVRILVNGHFVPRSDPFNYPVKEDDTIHILPPLVGG